MMADMNVEFEFQVRDVPKGRFALALERPRRFQIFLNGREVATISEAGCKGCGGCVPMCPENAIDLLGYTDAQITATIEGLVEVPA